VDASTAAPLASATVDMSALSGGTSLSASADAAGSFCFPSAEPGRYQLRAERAGYVAGSYGARVPGQPAVPVNVYTKESPEKFVIQLWREASISGLVVDEQETPLANADVVLYQPVPAGARGRLLPVWTGSADKSGAFVATGLAPGAYYVATDARRSTTGTIGVPADEVFAMSFYPGTEDPASAVPITVRAGDQFEGAKVKVKRMRAAAVRGRINRSPGSGGTGAAVVTLSPKGLVSLMGFSSPSVHAAADESFVIPGVLPGSYTLKATVKDGNSIHAASQDLDVGKYGSDGVRLQILPSINIRGTVVVEGRQSAAQQKLYISLTAKDSGELVTAAECTAPGNFTLDQIPAGTYMVGLSGVTDGLYVKAILLGRANVMSDGLLVAGSSPGTLQVLLSSKGAEISGMVTDSDGKPAQALVVMVRATQHGSARPDYRTQASDRAGTFTARGLAPGEYVVAGLQEFAAESLEDPEVVKRIEQAGQRVQVTEESRTVVKVELAKLN
jgi:hypothetical protein